jgi:CRISPR/Cas system Type II protein with McrA/HNH and RuvC-like nuclease domain
MGTTYNRIYKHQNKSCFYCDEIINLQDMEKEHVFPKSKGGRGIKNKVLSCSFCNRLKDDLTIENFKLKINELIKTTTDKKLIIKYTTIVNKLNKLLDGLEIRKNWHKKAIYKSININKIPVKTI